jgi:hypothetical protein
MALICTREASPHLARVEREREGGRKRGREEEAGAVKGGVSAAEEGDKRWSGKGCVKNHGFEISTFFGANAEKE